MTLSSSGMHGFYNCIFLLLCNLRCFVVASLRSATMLPHTSTLPTYKQSETWPRQNFCLPFLYYFNILFLLIEKSRIPLIDNSRMWQHRERYSRNKSSKPSGFYLEKPANSLPNGFVTDVRFILYFRWIHKKMFFPPLNIQCNSVQMFDPFQDWNSHFFLQQFNLILLYTSSRKTFPSKSWRRLLV